MPEAKVGPLPNLASRIGLTGQMTMPSRARAFRVDVGLLGEEATLQEISDQRAEPGCTKPLCLWSAETDLVTPRQNRGWDETRHRFA